MYRVISVSRNTSLLISRNDALGVAGFTVISPRHPADAPALAQQRQADAVVIGDSVPPEERIPVIKEVRRICPGCIVVFVSARRDIESEPLADVSVDVTAGPETLIEALSDRLPREQGSAA